MSKNDNVNIDSKPASGNSFAVIKNKKLIKVSVACRRDTNPELDGEAAAIFAKERGKDDNSILQICRYGGLQEPYFLAKVGRKHNFTFITFLVGNHHKKAMGFEGVPTLKNINKALKDTKLLSYEWTGQSVSDALAEGKTVYEMRDGPLVKIMTKAEKIVAKAEPVKPVKAKKVVAKKVVAKKTKAEPVKAKAKAKARVTWYKTTANNELERKRSVKQPAGFFSTENDAKKNKLV